MTDVQNLNNSLITILELVKKRVKEAQILVSYQKEIETDPTMQRLHRDLTGTIVSCTTAIRQQKEKQSDQSSNPSKDER